MGACSSVEKKRSKLNSDKNSLPNAAKVDPTKKIVENPGTETEKTVKGVNVEPPEVTIVQRTGNLGQQPISQSNIKNSNWEEKMEIDTIHDI
jgi:hypothetical protein